MRVALVAGPDAGHLLPVAALAEALAARGHSPVVWTGDRWLERLRGAGIAAEQLPLVAEPPGESFGERLWRRSVAMTPPLVAGLRAEPPALIVADTLTMCGSFAAGVLGVPLVELVPHPLQDPSAWLPPVGSTLPPARSRVGRHRDALLHRLTDVGVRLGHRQREGALASLGISRLPLLLRLVATLPALELPRRDWPSDAVLCGPLEWEAGTAELAPPPGDDPLVLVSSTTAGGPDLLSLVLEAAAGQHLRVAATTLDPRVGALPPWAVAGPGSQAPLLAAASAVVCGAGNGMLAKALSRGLPVVTIPGAGDQRENAARVHRLCAGIRLPPAEVTVPVLRRSLRRVVHDGRYAAGAADAARGAAGLGPAYAARLVERAARGWQSIPRAPLGAVRQPLDGPEQADR